MSQKEDTKNILRHLNNNIKSQLNSFEKAASMRQKGFALFQESLKFGNEAGIGLIADDHLKQYTKHVTQTAPNSVNNFSDEVIKLLKMRDTTIDLSKWNPILKHSTKDILQKPCSGQYMDCIHSEITENDLCDLSSSVKANIIEEIPQDIIAEFDCSENLFFETVEHSISENQKSAETFSKTIRQGDLKHSLPPKQDIRNYFQKNTQANTSNAINIINQSSVPPISKPYQLEIDKNYPISATRGHCSKNFQNSRMPESSKHDLLPLPKYCQLEPSISATKTAINPVMNPFKVSHNNPSNYENSTFKNESNSAHTFLPSSSNYNKINPIIENSTASATVFTKQQYNRTTLSTFLNLTTENNLREPCKPEKPISDFRSGKDELEFQNLKNYGTANPSHQQPLFSYGTTKKTLGGRRGVQSNFVPPIKKQQPEVESSEMQRINNIDPKLVELITNEIMHKFKPVDWNDIAGLEYAKSTIQEAVVWPLLRPDIFKGIRRPPRGILLFGPPGTGKTLIGKCIASQSKSTFFSISASSLASKYIGESEKLVRALFAVAAIHQPSVIFIDEIDSLLCQRSESEHESTRRVKTEFLVQLDGAATSEDERILIVGATNRPQELDEAARRRLVRRLYIPLPELDARIKILMNLLKSVKNDITEENIHEIGKLTEGYSGADMECLCREASMEPIRSIPPSEIPYFNENEVRPINFNDFCSALKRVRASVSQKDLEQYVEWNKTYGSGNVR